MTGFLHDLRVGLRGLARTPGFTAAAGITLALGIGANTAIFSVVNAVLLRPLPFEDPDRLVTLWENYEPDSRSVVSAAEIDAYRRRTDLLEGMAAVNQITVTLGGEEPEQLRGALVSRELFPMLGVTPARGRFFTGEEDAAGAGRVALVTHELWQRRFGGDPALVGRTLQLDPMRAYGPALERSGPATVVGVLPAGFRVPFLDEGVHVWMPLAADAELLGDDNHFLFALGRLREGVDPGLALAELRRLAAELDEDRDAHSGNPWRVDLVPLREVVVSDVRPALLVLLGAVGFVLLTACANVASLLLARASVRRREIAVRAALGASPGRLVRHLLAESVLLALLGGAAGLALAEGGVRLLRRLAPPDLPRLDEIAIDPVVLSFAAGAALLTALLFGLAPALAAARPDVRETLQEAGRSVRGDRHGGRLRTGLVVGEVALALLLLLGAGLLLKSFAQLRDVDLGFRPEGALTLHLSLPRSTYAEPQDVRDFVRSLLSEVEALPDVRAAASTNTLPMSGWNSATPVLAVEGRPPDAPGESLSASYRNVSPRFLEALGLQLLRGRPLADSDLREGPADVALVNRAMARELWGGVDPVGRRLQLSPQEDGSERWLTVVGVLDDMAEFGPDAPPPAMMYTPTVMQREFDLVVRTGGAPEALAPAVRAAVRRLDPALPISDVSTLEDRLSRVTAPWRFNAVAVGLFSVLALLLAATGVYGVAAYAVAQRRHEIGVRMALGAARTDVLRLVLGRTLRLVAIGAALGLVGAVALSRSLRSLLFGVEPADPGVFGAGAALLALVAVAASGLPALRASRLDPATTLRDE